MMKLQKYINRAIVTLTLLFLFGCSGVKEVGNCPEVPVEGNLGAEINTVYDESMPVKIDGRLYFSFNAGEDGFGTEILYRDPVSNTIKTSTDFLFNEFELKGTPYFYRDYKNNLKALVSGRLDEASDYDIYELSYINGMWAQPVLLPISINSEADEIMPTLSPNGKSLYFSSNRVGGLGGYDIYYAEYENTIWGDPLNVGDKINSASNELNPLQDYMGGLYYSSDTMGNYDIFFSEYSDGLFINSYRLLHPINSSSDEETFGLDGTTIYLSSNREGGCGGTDLYEFSLCKDIFLEGRVIDTDGQPIYTGTVELMEDDSQINSFNIAAGGSYRFFIEPNKVYSVRYGSDCLGEYLYSDTILALCNSLKPVKFIADVIIGKQTPVFTFEDYSLPFFSTGYYKPMTTLNLAELRQQLSYGVFGSGVDTKYINNPDDTYDQLAPQIDRAMSDAKQYLYKSVERLRNECNGIDEIMIIEIDGYADPRPIPKESRYKGPDIKDAIFGIDIPSGISMNNELLSKLRAYYTALEFEKSLAKHPAYKALSDRVVWKIKGKGVDPEPSKDMLYQRHVAVDISIIPAKND